MSVATQLDLHDPTRGLLGQAREAWPGWCTAHPDLAVAGDLLDLPTWMQHHRGARADAVLHTLARLASPTGADDPVAAGALAWLLLPGACLLAHRLRSLTARIDEVVAAQLWLEVRGFAWERLEKVAANIVMNTRRGVLADLGIGSNGREADPTWARTFPLEPTARLWQVLEARRHEQPAPAAAADELAEVLQAAIGQGVIDECDADLLVTLAVAADHAGVTRTGCGRGGLCTRAATRTVARRMGISATTVRRRASGALAALTAACAPIPA